MRHLIIGATNCSLEQIPVLNDPGPMEGFCRLRTTDEPVPYNEPADAKEISLPCVYFRWVYRYGEQCQVAVSSPQSADIAVESSEKSVGLPMRADCIGCYGLRTPLEILMTERNVSPSHPSQESDWMFI